MKKVKKDKKQSKIKKQARITRMLLQKVPQTPKTETYLPIPPPEQFSFPLAPTMLEGITLLENYFPEQTNIKIRNKLKGRIQRLSRFNDVYCVLGKGGKGMVIGEMFLDVRGVTAYCYGPNYLIIAYEDLRLDVYSMSLKLIKSLKNFTQRKITFLKLLTTPPNFQSIVLLSNTGTDVIVHRIEKSLFSGLSHKYNKKIIHSLQFPVTQMIQIPTYFKYYLRKDPSFKDCSLVAISAINCIWILKVNHFKMGLDNFIQVDFFKRVDQIGTNSLSWGQTTVESFTRDIKGDKLLLTCSFGHKVYFIILKDVEKYAQQVAITTKAEWLESFPFKLEQNKSLAFCQFMKKNQLLLITEDNHIVILNTRKNFDIFDKQIHEDQIQTIEQKFPQHLQARTVALIPKRVLSPSTSPSSQSTTQENLSQLKSQLFSQKQQPNFQPQEQEQFSQQFQLINKQPIVTYADTFQYEYPSDQIYYLTEKQFGVYVYCDWQRISDHMKVQQRYQSVMVFLISIYKRVNKFDLGMGETIHSCKYNLGNRWQVDVGEEQMRIVRMREKQLSQYIQLLTIEFISNKLLKIKDIPEILDNIISNEEFFKLIIIPIEFLCETQEFTFLFEVIKDKIISSLIPYSNNKKDNELSYSRAQNIFYTALGKFIEHGKIKSIPETQLQQVLDYYLYHDQPQMVDQLAIYFELDKVDQNILVQTLLNHNLVVSLAYICTQGNQSLFVTPFVKFWGVSENYKKMRKMEEAAVYAFRALWYIRLCLQRNWILKEYSLEKYANMLGVLSRQFLNEKILVALLEVRPQYCLQTLSFYFTRQNAQIVNSMQINFPVMEIEQWVQAKHDNQKLQLLLTTIQKFVKKSTKSNSLEYKKNMSLFLSSIIIYKTVKYTSEKYFQIIINLIESYKHIKSINYGLEPKMIEEFRTQLQDDMTGFSQIEFQEILAARYIVKILTLVYYECQDVFQRSLYSLYEKSREYQLTDLQAEICFLQNNYASCIEIYMRAKNSQKTLIYQFLQSCFKRLVLQKKKQQKDQLSACIKNNIKNLVQLHPRKTKTLIQNYIPQIHEQLIQALQDDQQLQLDYLNDIMHDEYHPNLKHQLTQTSILRYVELMALYRPDELLECFKKNVFFPVQESLKICEKYQVYDCIEYLYERMGCITEAVKIAALRIDKILKSRIQYEEDDFQPYFEIKAILDNAIDICKKNHSEQIWQALLDSSIQLYQKYSSSELPEDELEVFFFINGEIMENLASNCTIQHTIQLLQTKYNNLNMGGKMTRAFINILSDLSHSINILYLSTNLVQMALCRQLQYDYLNKLRCFRTYYDCQTCRFPIDMREKSIHFQCGHAYHKECVVCQEPMTCVACLMRQTNQFEYYLKTLNPRFPKIKKINQLFQKYSDKRLEMSEIFKIEAYQRNQAAYQPQIRLNEGIQESKKNLFQEFDEKVYEIETGNRRVEEELTF